MKYSIITPTYNRPDLLKRAFDSVINQEIKNEFASEKNKENEKKIEWEMIMINDSPLFDYSSFENYLEEIKNKNPKLKNKIKYFKNEKNSGNNFSKNFAIENISDDSDYLIFLDDDDYFSNDALEKINEEIIKNKNKKDILWLLTNRIKENKESLTKVKNKKSFSYFLDYLLLKNISGDATHIIKTSIIKNKNLKIKFSEKIKNGEEWFFFIQIPSSIIYKNINSTISGGYLEAGLTKELKNKYKENTKILWKEIIENEKRWSKFKSIKIFIYMILRSLKSLVK